MRLGLPSGSGAPADRLHPAYSANTAKETLIVRCGLLGPFRPFLQGLYPEKVSQDTALADLVN